MPIGGDENTHDNRRLDLLVTICVFAVASWITTSLRVYVRLRMIQGQSLRREDWVMVACQACFTLHFIFQGIGWHYGNGIHIADLETSNAEKALLHWWLAGMFYIWGSTLVKVSIGMLLLHFITNRFQRFLVYNVTFNCIVLGAAYSILLIFDCKPISYWWNLDPLAKGTCLPSKAFLIIGYVIAGLNAIADCTYAIVPFIIMSNTTMDVRTRAVVCGILGIGSITCIVTFIRIPFGHAFEGYKGDFLWATTPIAIFSTMELGLGIVAANCATFRPIFQHFFPNSFISHDAPPMAESAPTAHTHTDEEKAEPKPIVIAERKKPRFSRINAKTGIASLSGTEDQ
ncbi:hypothetical protein K461DRAFT_263922 [Myriangium duriaei CBS 260.36]|uniref:Rhodopsin domain-containing protein n=1 Tax=Myriangium duriaei CBS 260.36 TaxID=1168546 RepID=A0A9P4J8E2_9PEZI|nr:hypothetical protein K461DRAFT_263922 [Myriangium duriaei CBS 260.36]